MNRRIAVSAIVSLALFCCVTAAQAADQALIEAAKREGELTWYTTQRPPFANAAAAAFEAKYAIKVNQATYTSSDVALRISNEGRGGSPQADIFDGTEGVSALKKEGLVLQWQPDSAKRLPAQYVDPNGYWVAANIYVLSPAFNKDLVPKGGEPRTLDDLLDPKWQGKMVWSSTPTVSGSIGFIGLILTEFGDKKGTEYLHKLAAQNITPILGSPATLNQVVTGEYAIALHVFTGQVADAAAKGAPVAWIPMAPALALFAVIGLPKGAPHPNAGKLMMDFLLSEEGQQIYARYGYITVDPNVPPQDPSLRPDGMHYRALYFTPDQIADLLPKFSSVYQDIFR